MSDATATGREAHAPEHEKEPVARPTARPPRLAWETPKMEDVSRQVMAQPYIRFT